MRLRRLLPTLLLVFLAALTGATAASADVRTGQVADPQDSPNNPLDLEQVRASLDRDAGTVTMTVRVFGAFPQTGGGLTYVLASIGRKTSYDASCDTYGRGAVSANLGMATGIVSSGTGAWQASVTVRGEYSGRSQSVRVTFSADRREATFTATDEILRTADDTCFAASASYGEGPSDPDLIGGHPYDLGTVGWFDGFAPAPPAPSTGTPTPGTTPASALPDLCDGEPADDTGMSAPKFVAWGRTATVKTRVDPGASAARLVVGPADAARPIVEPLSIDVRGSDRNDIEIHRGDGRVRATLTWTDFLGCPHTKSREIATGEGKRVTVATRRTGNAITFAYPRLGACTAHRPTTVRVIVSGRGRKATLTDSDLCDGAYARRGGGGLFTLAADGEGAWFAAPSTRSNVTWRFRFLVLVGGKRVDRGSIVVTNVYDPPRRVYAWHGTKVNDEYWNYCVNEAKQTWMHHGNAYCVVPAYRDQILSLR